MLVFLFGGLGWEDDNVPTFWLLLYEFGSRLGGHGSPLEGKPIVKNAEVPKWLVQLSCSAPWSKLLVWLILQIWVPFLCPCNTRSTIWGLSIWGSAPDSWIHSLVARLM